MTSLFKTIQQHALLRGIVYLLLGVAILLNPGYVFSVFVYLIAGYNAVLGIISLISGKKNQQSSQTRIAIFYFVMALIIFLFAKPLVSILPIFLGIIIVVSGGMKISQSLNIKKYVNVSYLPMLIYGVVLVIAGLFILFNPFKGVLVLFQFFGVVLVFSGISELIGYFKYKNMKNPDIF